MKSWLALSWVIAFSIWGMPAQCNTVTQAWRPMPGNVTAWADPLRCRMTYSSTPPKPWTWGRVCAATIHEWGHIDGRRHSRNPRSIMYPILHGDRRCHHYAFAVIERTSRERVAETMAP